MNDIHEKSQKKSRDSNSQMPSIAVRKQPCITNVICLQVQCFYIATPGKEVSGEDGKNWEWGKPLGY